MRGIASAPRVWAAALSVAAGLLCPAGAAAQVQAGAAKQALTLPKWVPLAGYSRRGGAPARGVHDEIGVRALVVQDADTTVALVSCDLLIIDEVLFAAVQRRLAALYPVRAPQLLLAATHTHSGPGAYGRTFFEKRSMGHFDPDVFHAIVETVVETIRLARSRLEAVRLAYHRDLTEDLVENRVASGGVVDPELIVCAFYGLTSEQPLAVLVSFSAHPTTLGAWNMRFSADYPGAALRAIEARWPSATGLFFAAAVGDQAPVKRGEAYEPARRIGERLAERVIALLEGATPVAPSGVLARSEALPLPPAKVRLGAVTLPGWISRWFVDDDATLSVVRVGDVVFQGVPCDLTAGLGMRLKDAARAQALKPVVLGFVNDYIGYCIPETLYHSGHYEASMAFNGPQTGELVVERLVEMVVELGQGRTPSRPAFRGRLDGDRSRVRGTGRGQETEPDQ